MEYGISDFGVQNTSSKSITAAGLLSIHEKEQY